jgi:hypothetical protein
MIILFDTATSALSIDTANAEPYGGDLVGTLNRHGQVISLRGLSYGARLRSTEPRRSRTRGPQLTSDT